MREPVTTDTRISYIDLRDRLVVFDRPTSCGMCRSCLACVTGRCFSLGPYSAEGIVLSTPNQGAIA